MLSFSCIARSLVVFRPVGSRTLETLNKITEPSARPSRQAGLEM
jgi:hypothetical protein